MQINIKMFFLRNAEAVDGVHRLPEGWFPVNIEGSDNGGIYVYAYSFAPKV